VGSLPLFFQMVEFLFNLFVLRPTSATAMSIFGPRPSAISAYRAALCLSSSRVAAAGGVAATILGIRSSFPPEKRSLSARTLPDTSSDLFLSISSTCRRPEIRRWHFIHSTHWTGRFSLLPEPGNDFQGNAGPSSVKVVRVTYTPQSSFGCGHRAH